jgi:citrate lyase subunit beta/citryl-CoA lyase
MRSLLFVPADSPRKLAKAADSAADALIVDLEDSVAAGAKDAARKGAAEFLAARRASHGRQRLFVRINSLDSGLCDADLDAVMSGRPDGIMLPKAAGGVDVQHLGAKLAVREAENDLPDGSTVILPIATETPAAIFALGSYAGASRRTCGLTWGAEDLSAALGAETSRLPDGAYTGPYHLARDLTLFAAAAADVDAIDTIFADFRDMAGLQAECAAARRDGFTGKMAIHPDQIAAINAAFTPTDAALAAARALVSAFARESGAGVVAIDGVMYDRPHLRRAEKLLARAKSLAI